jgi:hypothetical protein
VTNLVYSTELERLELRIDSPTVDELLLVARHVRRERTGVHAMVGIACNNTILAYDVFNIDRNEEKVRLSRSAHKMLPQLLRETFPEERLKHELDLFCLEIPTAWDEVEIQFVSYNDDAPPWKPVPLLGSYIVEGGGSILFAPPGAGKSYITQLKAVCAATGNSSLWAIPQARPALLVNLERSAQSLRWRDHRVKQALGMDGPSGVDYLHARGKTIGSIKRHLYAWAKRHQGQGIIFVDSISRAAEGALGDDQTANEMTNALNGIDGSWYAIGHTPRATKDHMFGSIHWDAGADIQIKVSSERKDNELGIRLEVVKANDLQFPQPEYLALEFDEYGLTGVRHSRVSEFPELADSIKLGRVQQLQMYVEEVGGLADATAAAEATGFHRPDISAMFRHPPFVQVRREGHRVLYGIASARKE